MLPIQVSRPLADEDSAKIQAILRSIRESFHHDQIFGGAGPQANTRSIFDLHRAPDCRVFKWQASQGDIDPDSSGGLQQQHAVD